MKKKQKRIDLQEIVRKGVRLIRSKNDKYTSGTQKGLTDSVIMSRRQTIHLSVLKKAKNTDKEVIIIYGIDRRTFKRYVIGYVEPPIKEKY